MKRKLKDFFRKVQNKLFRKKTRGLPALVRPASLSLGYDDCQSWQLSMSPEWFHKQFEAAYPDGAKFLQQLHIMSDTDDAFLLSGSFAASGFVAAAGFPATYREWERQRVQEIKEKYPNLKILVLHEDFPTDEEV